MNIEIKSMDISNFKGIHSLHLEFHSGVNTLYGDNATGKTSVYDALTWLLFGKDSHGNSTFSIKPMDVPAGSVTPDVSVILMVNGEELKLRKFARGCVFCGSEEAVFDFFDRPVCESCAHQIAEGLREGRA